MYQEIAALDAEVLAISMDSQESLGYAPELPDSPYPVLYTSKDPTVPNAYHAFDIDDSGLSGPATFIVDQNGKIGWFKIGTDNADRPPTSVVISALEFLNKQGKG